MTDKIKELEEKLLLKEQIINEIKEICCNKTRNCNNACFLCATNCNEKKILGIINKAKDTTLETQKTTS